MNTINFTINGKEVIAQKGETILTVARREGIDIPTMCYLTKVSPIASCRMCVVEADNTDGFVLSCQTPPVEGVSITTHTDELKRHRDNIMSLYAVNHPLECGVCDKSGECDLQNKTLEFGTATQNFSVRDQKRTIQDWGMIQYDPSLCILCEKCVSTCNEAIGDDAIEVKYGGYGSHIGLKDITADTLDCTFCGECISVCPVGALVSSEFKYSANAWESQSIPASCAHCSGGCALYYDVKDESRITRVQNDYEVMSLCGAGRFGFDFQNTAKNDDNALENAVSAFKSADSIVFNSYITNEEALLLQRLKEKHGLKLVNHDALAYQTFLEAYSSVTGKNMYSAKASDLRESDFSLVFGSALSTDAPYARYLLNEASKKHRAQMVYMHPIEDNILESLVTQHIKYEVGSEEGVIALVVREMLKDREVDADTKSYIDALDEGYLSAESNVGEEEIEKIAKNLTRSKHRVLVLGADLYTHERASNIATLSAMLEKYLDFKTMILPTSTNTLGVAKICDLDQTIGNNSVGYNEAASFVISSHGNADVHVAALNQQEGTFTNYEGRVVPTNVAVSYEGITLNDIVNAMGVGTRYTVDMTAHLPIDEGYESVAFDDLNNTHNEGINDTRGYLLRVLDVEDNKIHLDEIADIESYDGVVAYRCNPVLQFNENTASCRQLEAPLQLFGSAQFAVAARVKDGDKIKVTENGNERVCTFALSEELKGTISQFGDYNMSMDARRNANGYRYNKIKIEQVG